MNLSLSPELETFIENEVKSGFYRSASEVVRAGLRLLRERQGGRLPELPATREELEAQLLASIESLEDGKAIDGKDSMKNFRNRVKTLGADD